MRVTFAAVLTPTFIEPMATGLGRADRMKLLSHYTRGMTEACCLPSVYCLHIFELFGRDGRQIALPNPESDTRFLQLSFTILLLYRSVYRFPAFEDGPPEFGRLDLAPSYCFGLGVDFRPGSGLRRRLWLPVRIRFRSPLLSESRLICSVRLLRCFNSPLSYRKFSSGRGRR